jgi:molecular chaperone GrpE
MSDPTELSRIRRNTRPSIPVQDDIMAGSDGDRADAGQADSEVSEPAAAGDTVEARGEAVEAQAEVVEAQEEGVDAQEAGGDAPEDVEVELPRHDFRDQRIKMLEEALTEREQMLQDYIRAHKKAQTEFEGFKTRMRAKEEGYADATRGKVVERMLDVYDNLQRSLEASRLADTVGDIRAGVELVARDFLQRLEELGLERFDPIGQVFNPEFMEAVGVVPVAEDERNGTVVMTIKPGFRLKNREIRPAVVQVGRKF